MTSRSNRNTKCSKGKGKPWTEDEKRLVVREHFLLGKSTRAVHRIIPHRHHGGICGLISRMRKAGALKDYIAEERAKLNRVTSHQRPLSGFLILPQVMRRGSGYKSRPSSPYFLIAKALNEKIDANPSNSLRGSRKRKRPFDLSKVMTPVCDEIQLPEGDHCKYPFGDMHETGLSYCPLPRVPGHDYCLTHLLKTYQPDDRLKVLEKLRRRGVAIEQKFVDQVLIALGT